MSHLLGKYIGIPFVKRKDKLDGADCFGLVRLIYREEVNTDIFKHQSDADNIRSIIIEYMQESQKNWINVKNPQMFDVIAMARDPYHPNIIQHYGIYIGNGKMIHTLKELGSHVSKIEDYKYCIKAYHRHKEANKWQK